MTTAERLLKVIRTLPVAEQKAIYRGLRTDQRVRGCDAERKPRLRALTREEFCKRVA